ncbi:hypothetical protein COHCIP112018_05196 [Cohnella sp. JJ-181]|nr:hypothetical protein COHCIP112018_05196 [Cohnella sp. JJ-181]
MMSLASANWKPSDQIKVVMMMQTVNLNQVNVYIDSATIAGNQLSSMTDWKLSDDAVRSQFADSPADNWLNLMYQISFEGHSLSFFPRNGGTAIIAKPGSLTLSAMGRSGQVGYLVKKTIQISEGANLAISAEDIARTIKLTVPTDNEQVDLFNPEGYGTFQRVNQIQVSKGNYSLSLQTIDVEGIRNTWSSYNFDLQSDRSLQFGPPSIKTLDLSLSGKSVYASFSIQSGDFLLSNVSKLNGNGANLIQYGIKVINSQNNIVYEGTTANVGDSWLRADFNQKLSSGMYKVVFSATYPGLAQPLTETNLLRVENADDYADKGLYVTAENEKGVPLTEGTATLYRTQPPYVDEANEGIKANYTYKVDSWSLEDGEAIIPYSDLMKGLDYELVVTGDTSSGRAGVLYTASVTRDDQRLRFTAAGLKHVSLHASQANSGDPLLVGLLDEQGEESSYPWSIPFIGQTAEAWIQTSHTVDFFTKLIDGDSGYFLNKQLKLQSVENVIDLNGDLIEVALPSGYEGQLDINYSWYEDRFAAKHYYVTKGLNAVAYFDIDKEGYRYSLAKYLGPVNERRTLTFGSSFTNRTPEQQVYWAGSVNQKVYTDYWDSQDNLLTGVSLIETADIVRGMTSDNITFKLNDGGALRTIALEPASEGYGYTAIGYNDASFTNIASGGLVDYRLFDSANQPVGDPISAPKVDSFWLEAPLPKGAYTLRLTRQNFPDSFVKLTGEEKISVEGGNYYEDAFEVPVQYPDIYGFGDHSEGYALLQEAGGAQVPYTLGIMNGKLMIPKGVELKANQNYALHMILSRYESNYSNNVIYYYQLKVTGDELLQKKQISFPAQAKKLDMQFNDLPASLRNANATFTFSTADGGNTINIPYRRIGGYGTSMTLATLITAQTDFKIDLYGVNGGSIGYDMRKSVHVNADGKWTAVNDPTYELQLEKGLPFHGVQAFMNDSFTYRMSYDNAFSILDKVYVPGGRQSLQISTPVFSKDERAWYLDWRTRDEVSIDGKKTLAFTGQVEASQSTMTVTQISNGSDSIISVKPELTSGELVLMNASITGGNYLYYAPGIVTIRDSSNKKVYAGVAYGTGYDLTLTTKLDPGDYTLTYQMPTGPGMSTVLNKSITVTSGNNGGGGSSGGGGGGAGSGGGGGSVSEPGGAASPKAAIFKAEDIPAAANGVITLQIKDSEEVTVPASLLSGDGAKNALAFVGSHGKVSIPPAVLQQLAGLVGKDALADAQVSLSLVPISASEVSAGIKTPAGAISKAAGSVFEFKLSIQSKGGEAKVLSEFAEPITLIFEVNGDAEKSLANVFYIAEDGSLTFVPGKWVAGSIVANVNHFSKYGVLEIKKEFADVSASSWAYGAIRELAAKLVVGGTTADKFEPNRTVTRAEFTSMLVNALALKSQETAAFKDVPGTAWYASAVAAAFESGLVKGSGVDTFAPGRPITREEMAVIMANALKLADPSATRGQATAFKDAAKISNWAKEAVSFASANGLIKGDGTGGFNPKGMATRAEAAQMLVNLLNRTAQ